MQIANGSPLSEHSYVTPGWSAANSNVAEVASVTEPSPGPELIVVIGGPVTVEL